MVDYNLDENLKNWQAKIKEFAKIELKPNAQEWDKQNGIDPSNPFPFETLKKASKEGIRTLTVPKEMGGEGLGIFAHVVLLEELVAGEAGFGAVIHQGWKLAKMLCEHTTEEQRKDFLPRFMDVDTSTMAIGMTEPDHGTDNIRPATNIDGGMKLSAVKKGNNWVLNGKKHFIACAAMSNINFLCARTDPKVPVNEGVTLFIMPGELDGYRRGIVHGKMGCRLLMNGEMIYENAEVPDEWRLSEVNDGLPYMSRVFSRHSPTTATFGLGIARAAYEDAIDYAKGRVQGGSPIIEHDEIRERIADMYVSISVARDAIWQAAWHADNAAEGEYDHKEGMRVKIFASDMAPQVCSSAMNIFGGTGYMTTHSAERHMRDAMMCYHIDGLNDTVRWKLGRLIAGEKFAGSI